jgi:hypothetical protein
MLGSFDLTAWYAWLVYIAAGYLLWTAVFETGHKHVRWLWGRFRGNTAEPEPEPEAPKPDIRILRIEATGGQDGFVTFRVELANYGTQRAEATVSASVDGVAVRVGTRHVSVPDTPSARFDLVSNGPVDSARVLVPRPSLGD